MSSDSVDSKPEVTVVLPGYNEEAALERSTARVIAYLEQHYPSFEILIVNDGSRDRTPQIADELSRRDPRVRVLHHPRNYGLGQAFRTAFTASRGAYVVTLDTDLSYGPEHIGEMIERMRSTRAKLVLASPYMEGGKLTAVPRFRLWLSVCANFFLRFFARSGVSTITGMVRAYDGPFVRSLDLRSLSMEIMPEVIYKTMILRGRIEEVPGHLDWTEQRAMGGARTSSMKVIKHTFATVMAGFVFRPFMFFVLPGLIMLAFSLWVNAWAVAHLVTALGDPALAGSTDPLTDAMQLAYGKFPYTFIVGLLSLMVAIQLIGLGIIALQQKKNFEELFHLGTSVRRHLGGEYRLGPDGCARNASTSPAAAESTTTEGRQ